MLCVMCFTVELLLAVLTCIVAKGDGLPFGQGCATSQQRALAPQFCNASLSLDTRIASLVSSMTLEEKVNLTWITGCAHQDPTDGGVPRLGIPGYTWGVEVLHGAQAMCINGSCPTIFPVLAALASGFNVSAWQEVGAAISTEMRALNNMHVGRTPCPSSVIGRNGWGPNVNLVRDPRWGRNIEVGSEDAFVSGALGAAMITGMQGKDESKYVKLLASIKHFSVYSMEASDGENRKGFDPTVARRDMAEFYLPAFKAAIVDGGALGMMCSYTSVNGTPFCESKTWLKQWARELNSFEGNIVTDCGALNMPGPESKMDIVHNAAEALRAGTDLNCGQPWAYKNLGDAVKQSLVSESELDAAVSRSLKVRMLTGLFDPIEGQPYMNVGLSDLGSVAHHEIAYSTASQGLVLLQNPNDAMLPLSPDRKTAVIGPHAQSDRSLLGSYFDQACPSAWDCVVTPLAAICNITGVGNPIIYETGCESVKCPTSTASIEAAAAVAAKADQVIVLVGLDEHIESEGHDRRDTLLPGAQSRLVQSVVAAAAGKAIAVVLINGGIVSADFLIESHVAVMEAWYPGVQGGRAIADALFGRTNRFGKLPVTIYRESFSKQVKMLDMSFTNGLGRTYKYWRGDAPLYNFGHGLSYTRFGLRWAAALGPTTVTSLSDHILLNVTLSNEGSRDGDEVVFLFYQPLDVQAPAPLPAKQLVAFERCALARGASMDIVFNVSASRLRLVDNSGDAKMYPGLHALHVSRGHGPVLSVNVTVQTANPTLIEAWPGSDTSSTEVIL